MSLIYRPATAADAAQLAEISILAAGGTFQLLLEGMKAGVSTQEIMTTLCSTDNTEYSYRFFTVAELKGEVTGAINAMTIDQRYQLAANINPILQQQFKFGIWQLAKFYMRARHLRGMNVLKAPRLSLHINDVAVFPQFSGQGIGKQLVLKVIADARHQKLEYVSLYVWEDNKHAIEFYQHLGFVIAKTASVTPHKYLPHSASHLMLYKL